MYKALFSAVTILFLIALIIYYSDHKPGAGGGSTSSSGVIAAAPNLDNSAVSAPRGKVEPGSLQRTKTSSNATTVSAKGAALPGNLARDARLKLDSVEKHPRARNVDATDSSSHNQTPTNAESAPSRIAPPAQPVVSVERGSADIREVNSHEDTPIPSHHSDDGSAPITHGTRPVGPDNPNDPKQNVIPADTIQPDTPATVHDTSLIVSSAKMQATEHSTAAALSAPDPVRTKANNTDNLNLTSSWVGGVVPTSSDTALWDSTVTAFNTTVSLGADLNFGEIQITNPGTNITINAGNTLTLSGVSGVGIDMLSSTQALFINCAITLGAAQTWKAGGFGLYLGGSGAVNNGGNLLTITTTINPTTGTTAQIGTIISGAGGLTYSSTNGSLSLSGANTYTGATTIDGSGTLVVTTLANVNTASSIGKGSVAGSAADLVFGGGILDFTGASSASSTDRLFTIGDANGLTARIVSDTVTAANSLSFTNSGAIAFGGSGARTLFLTGSNTGNNTFAPILGDGPGGATSLNKSGTGTWIISGANAYSGDTTIGTGILRLGAANTIPDGTGKGNVSLFGTSGTLDLNTFSETINGLSGSGTVDTIAGGTPTFTVGNNNANSTFGGIIKNTAGTLALTKIGTGTLTLSGANTYTGTTTISGGILEISNTNSASSGRISGTSSITVNSGGTLLLSGSSSFNDRINNSAAVTVNGGTFRLSGVPEGTTAANGVGALTLSSNSSIDLTSTSLLHLAASNAQIWAGTLNILNWNGMLVTGGGAEQLLFGTNVTALTAAQLLEIQFVNPAGCLRVPTSRHGPPPQMAKSYPELRCPSQPHGSQRV